MELAESAISSLGKQADLTHCVSNTYLYTEDVPTGEKNGEKVAMVNAI
jgi:hypothetical protein